ncbi:retrovirus-related pol polyprotein from transposon TNT 1-94 [Tanacetum coccineum]|uniref:Retrovirus-related pol polyprotein from transposon TNT 1-94 n=1 Tax=Tanacetum coccineum TaxID=301880 RepID=A0ABQ4YBQ1_9ASTR
MQTQTSSALHNAIIEAGGEDHPPMLVPGNYNPPYQYKFKATDVDVTPATPGNDGTPQQPQPRGEVMKIFATVSEDIQKWITAEVEAIQIILTGIDNDIYSTVDAYPNAMKMWKAIERLKQGGTINVQDLETNLYWEFRKFTLQEGETLDSYYSWFYKMMNELVRNQCNPPYQYKFKATDVDVTPATPGNDGTPQQPQPRGENGKDMSPLIIQTTPEYTIQAVTQEPTVTASKNINQADIQAEIHDKNAQVDKDEFINIFSTPRSPLEQVIGNPSHPVRTRRQLETDGEMCMFALSEELHQFERLDVWELVDRPLCKNVINMKWLWKNKHYEENIIIRNKACLVAKGYSQVEVYQMEVKTAFLNGPLNEEVYVDPHHPDKVYRLKKALCGLKQAPRAWYDELSNFLLSKGFSKGCLDTCKITSGGIQFLGGDKLINWSSKKQDCTSISTAEAEYVSLSTCCAQVLWMKTQLTDYGFHYDKIPMYCDSKAAITISCNPVQHSRTNHIDVRYHFIKEHVERGIVELFFVGIEYELVDIFTKALSEDRCKYHVRRLGMRCLTSTKLEKISPPKDAETPVESPIPISPSSSVGSSSPVRSTTPPPDYPFDKSILDNSLWIIPQPLGSEPVPEKPNESDTC